MSIDGITFRNHIPLCFSAHVNLFVQLICIPYNLYDIMPDHHFQEPQQFSVLYWHGCDSDRRPRPPHTPKIMTWCISTLHLEILCSLALYTTQWILNLSIQMLGFFQSTLVRMSTETWRQVSMYELGLNLDWAFSSLSKVITHSCLTSSSLLQDLPADSPGQETGWLLTRVHSAQNHFSNKDNP